MRSPFKKIKIFLIIIIVLFLAVAAYFIEDGYNMYKEAVRKVSIEEKVKEIRNDRNYVEKEDISKDLLNAVVSIEDKRFYEHFGVDLYSIGRAFVNNLQSNKITGGGSTITQQLAKNMYFTQDKKITRKIAEIFVALDLEEKYEKDDILELYLNVIYFGDGYYGVREASNGYFNKEPIELDLYESSLIAGIPNAPSVYALSNNSPYTYQRQRMVLKSMLDGECITKTQYDEILDRIKDLE